MKKWLTQIELEEIKEKNLMGKDLADLAKEYNTSWACIYHCFKRRNWTYQKGLHRSKKYINLKNPTYFENIDSHEKAYFLGFIYADGCISRNTLSLKLKNVDDYIIKILHKRLNITNKISTSFNENKNTIFTGFTISSDILTESLLKLGVQRNKSKKEMNVPLINPEFYNSFILGFFDGDGWTSVSITDKKRIQIGICCSSLIFLQDIRNILKEKNIDSNIYCDDRSRIKSNYSKLYTLTITKNTFKILFLNFIYKDSKLFLRRKFKKYLQANTVLNLESKNSKSV